MKIFYNIGHKPAASLRRLRLVLALFMAGLVLSGITALPLERELELLASGAWHEVSVSAVG